MALEISNKTLPISKPEQPQRMIVREALLRPLPKITLRSFVVLLVLLIVYTWSIKGTKADPEQLIKGVPNMVSFVVRLFPIDFDWRAIAKLPVEIHLPFTVNAVKFTDTLDGDPELEKVQSELAQSVPLDEAIASGKPLAESALTPIAAPADETPKAWFEWQPSVLSRVWVPGILPYVIETLQMAVIGTTLAIFLALPVGLLAARNTSPHPIVYQLTRLVMNINRAIPELIVALVFVAAVGLGPFTGVLALAVASIGSLGRLYSEAIEQIDPQQVLAVRATGASSAQVFGYAVIPQVLPLVTSYSLVYFEHNVRAATILGIVGAGGVGLALQQYIALFQFRELMGAVIVLCIAVTVIDRVSAHIRLKLI
jgi:phosphonate transport system permease protein